MNQQCRVCRDHAGIAYEATGAHPCHNCHGTGVVPERTERDTLRLLLWIAKVRWSKPRRRQESE